VDPKDVVHVLRNMVDAVKPGGVVLDLQVIPTKPVVEVGGAIVCEIEGDALFMKAGAAAAAVDGLVACGRLAQEAVDDHDVLKHYANGEELVEDWARSGRFPAAEALPRLRATAVPCVTRERCRLRRLRVT
jgi:hypothetical protein